MKTNIWTPLSMNSTTFRPWTRPEIGDNRVVLAWRNKEDGSMTEGKPPFRYPASDCCGGVGLYSTPSDQARLLQALLQGDLLSPVSLDELLSPQTANPNHFLDVVCGDRLAHLGMTWIRQTWPEGMTGDCGLSCCINTQPCPGRRFSGSANWQGIPGVHLVSPNVSLPVLSYTG
jgi:CubicO group peptidase (beta-lactamase class C family)